MAHASGLQQRCTGIPRRPWRRLLKPTDGKAGARSFERRLFWTTCLSAVSLLPALVLALHALHAASVAQRRLNQTFVRTLALTQDLRVEQSIQDAIVPVFVLTGDRALLDTLERSRSAWAATVAALRAIHLSSSQLVLLDRIVALQAELVAEEAPGFTLRQAGRPVPEVDDFFREHAAPLVHVLNAGIADLAGDARHAYEAREDANEAGLRIAVVMIAASLLLAVCSLLFASRSLLRTVVDKKAADAEAERAAERLKAVATARKEAVETVAHDLRNPLTAIILLAEQMGSLAGKLTNERGARMLDGIANAAESMRLLIFNLLDHAKIEAGTLALSLVTDDVVPLLRVLVARYEVLAARGGVRVIDALPRTLPPVTFDSVRLEQAFANLLGNAVKFTPKGGTVTLSGLAEPSRLVLAVSDTGSGMDAGQLEKVFDRYWQAGETASWGTGLGLAISKAVVDAHGGSMVVASERGAGSTFTVSLPRAQPSVR